ncbi:MAG: HAMP domain-containing sensor histidine kinase [bacterium]
MKNFKKINYIKPIDTITTKILTLVLFIIIIPLMVVANFSTGLIDQSMFDIKKNELYYNTKLSKEEYKNKINKIIEVRNKNIELISIISVISLIVAIILAALFSRTITTPILKLVAATKSIASGNLKQRVKIRGNDEIAQLASMFNQMANNLQQHEQLRDNFIATLTHDLKVPMLAENQTINYFLKEIYGPITNEQREVLELIKNTNNSCLEMIYTLLDVYRYDNINIKPIKSDFDIIKLIKESIDEINSLAVIKKIKISLITSENELFIKADKREIKRILYNLISNAINNGVQEGKICCNIELISNEEYFYYPKIYKDIYTTLNNPVDISNTVLVSIEDNGIGISEDDMGQLFKRFSLSKGRKPASTGLGLYYSHQVITKHNGYIWAESFENQGSSFKFTLPVENTEV